MWLLWYEFVTVVQVLNILCATTCRKKHREKQARWPYHFCSCLTHLPLSYPWPLGGTHIPSTSCDAISFNSQGQLCLLNCTEWRDLSNHTRMNKIQSRTWEKKAKNQVILPEKFLENLVPLPPKSFPKIFPTKCPTKEKKQGRKISEKRGEERKWKVKVKTAVSLAFKPSFAFCACPNFIS